MGNSKVPDAEGAAAPQEAAAPARAKKKYLATFTANRSFEAHVGGEVISFGPYETVPLDEGTVSHSDFKAIVAAGLLQVKEVSK
jgi:hypothetical protein